MTTISKTSIGKTAIVALMTATIGFSAIAPSFAQDAAPAAPTAQAEQKQNFRQHNQGPRDGGRMGGGDFFSIERGVEAIEIAFVRLSHNLELTAEQQPLFDAFKAASLAAATDFAAATEGLRPAAPAAGETPAAPDMATRLDNGITLQAARLAALEAVQPSATAFFESLTEEQTAAMTPQRPDRDGGMPGGHRQDGERGPGKHGAQHGGQQGMRAPSNG